MIGENDFDKPLPDEKKGEKFDEEAQKRIDEPNEMLRACFAAGSFRRAVEAPADCPAGGTKYEAKALARYAGDPEVDLTCKHCGEPPDQHTAADADVLRRFCGALSKGRMRELSLDFGNEHSEAPNCALFTPDVAGQLGAALGRDCKAHP